MSWRDFWNRENSIYVNDRHRALHDERIASDIARLIGDPQAIVLDYGCGASSSADRVAAVCGRLYLYDGAEVVRARLAARFGGRPSIVVLGEGGLADVADASLDLVVVNSVLQYVSRPHFEDLLDRFRAKLKSTGRLILGDIVPPDANAVGDIRSLLTFAWQGGFLFAACGGLVSTFFSDYRKLRAQYGLTSYAAADMIALLAAHGFVAAQAPRNIGYNQTRMTFEARPAG